MQINLITGLWVAWLISWIVASGWSNSTVKRLQLKNELKYRAFTALGVLLIFVHARGQESLLPTWQLHHTGDLICAALVILGFAFCWWARIHLGRLWSGSITHKENHRVIDTGPYAWVRHPIYTGLDLAILASVIANGTSLGVIGGAFIVFSFWLKARMEEGWLSQELGSDAYATYRQRVPMLIPLPPMIKK